MSKDVCPECGCCNHCDSRHGDEGLPTEQCPLDNDTPVEVIEQHLRDEDVDLEAGKQRFAAVLDLGLENRRLVAKLADLDDGHSKLLGKMADKIHYIHSLIGERNQAVGDVERLTLGLRNVRALAVRMMQRGTFGSDDGMALIRFCAEAGVDARILREDAT